LVVAWHYCTDPDHGAETLVRLQWLAWVAVAAGPTYLIRRGLMGSARTRQAWSEAMRGNVAAGIALAGAYVLTGLIFLGVCGQAHGAEISPPAAALPLLPVLQAEQRAHWPDMPSPAALGAQVEQETCISLRSRGCWNPRTELKTDREYGFGLGQITITSRFDNFAAARGLDPSLRTWQFADRYDPARQLRVLVLMDRAAYQGLSALPAGPERLAMAFSAYNGGLGGVQADRRVCAQVRGCNPARWWGHVELHSLKARSAVHGYGQSFYDINRGYVRSVLIERRPRYVRAMGA